MPPKVEVLARNGAGEGNPVPQVSLRDWFAGLALSAMVTTATPDADAVAAKAYKFADAMLAARTKG